MSQFRPLSRRSVLKGASALGAASVMPFGFVGTAQAAHSRFVARMERDIQNLDPANRVSTVEGNILRATYQRLADFKPGSFEWQLDAAAELKQVSDTEITFTLKPGQKFAGGYGEMTAEDVKFSFERFNNPPPGGKKATYAADWAALDKVEVTGPLSGRIILKNPAPALWTTAICDSSGCIVSKKAFEALGDKVMTQTAGSGPYLQAEWVANQRFVLKRNPDWQGAKPVFEEIVLRPVSESKTAEIAFKSNEIDFTRVDISSVDDFKKAAATKLTTIDAIDYIWIGMNVEKKPLDNVKVRQAIKAAVDVSQVLDGAYDGKVKPAKSLIPPALLGSWKDAPAPKRDVALAKKLLAEAGLPNGFKTRITVLNQPVYKNAALVVQANLAEVGIECEVDAQDGGTYWSSGKAEAGQNLDLSLQLFKGKADPSFYTQWFLTSQVGNWNWQRWKNEEFDNLHKAAASTNDPAERTKALVRMQQLMEESAAYIWLTHDVLVFASKDWLKPAVLPNGSDWQLPFFSEA